VAAIPGRRWTALAGPGSRERGSAVAEFVMVAGLLLLIAVGVFQLGLTLHVRNTLVACAAEGARAGARADAPEGQATARTVALITDGLSSAYAAQVTSHRVTTADGVRVVEVTVTAPTPIIGLLGPSGTMTVTGRAFDERQVATP
jgi:Flp pilus assembly protein TadG